MASRAKNPWSSGLTTACGVFGCVTAESANGGGAGGRGSEAVNDPAPKIDVSKIICLGLVALQHRGQESAGIVTSQRSCLRKKQKTSQFHDGGESDGKLEHEEITKYDFHSHKDGGLVSQVFSDSVLKELVGEVGIGHNRLVETGGRERERARASESERERAPLRSTTR